MTGGEGIIDSFSLPWLEGVSIDPRVKRIPLSLTLTGYLDRPDLVEGIPVSSGARVPCLEASRRYVKENKQYFLYCMIYLFNLIARYLIDFILMPIII